MNSVQLIGRLTKDPEIRYTTGMEPVAVATLTVAVDRPSKGEDRKADFPRVIVWGKQAENCERYLAKGSQVAVAGRIQTGSYEKKDGTKVYTTDVVASNVEFLGSRNEVSEKRQPIDVPEAEAGYEYLDDDDDIPW